MGALLDASQTILATHAMGEQGSWRSLFALAALGVGKARHYRTGARATGSVAAR